MSTTVDDWTLRATVIRTQQDGHLYASIVRDTPIYPKNHECDHLTYCRLLIKRIERITPPYQEDLQFKWVDENDFCQINHARLPVPNDRRLGCRTSTTWTSAATAATSAATAGQNDASLWRTSQRREEQGRVGPVGQSRA